MQIMPSPEILVFAPLIIFAAYVIFGISGFGSTLIAVPLLAHLYPLTFVIPVVVMLDCFGAFTMGLRLRADVHTRELLPLAPFMLIGMAAGVYLLLQVPAFILLACLGTFVLAYGAIYALGRGSVIRLARWSAAPLGLFAGATSSAFGVGGPLYVFYLTGRGATPGQLRASIPVIFMFTTITRIALFLTAGLFNQEVLLTAALLFPVMLIGLYAGNRLHGRLRREHAIRIIGGFLIASGVSLLMRALQ